MQRFALAVLIAATAVFPLTRGGALRPAAAAKTGPAIIAAGVPPSVAATHNYDRIYGELARAGMKIYFPYQAFDGTVGTGANWEFVDFYGLHPPGKSITCNPKNAAFTRLPVYGIQLLLSGDNVYNRGAIPTGPVTDDDPLQRLINCAGRANIAGILTYDESVFNDVPVEEMQAFYTRVKRVDATLPVFNVQAPLLRTDSADIAPARAAAYFAAVKDTFRFADVSGFDVYPRPDRVLEALATPYSSGRPAGDYRAAIRDYATWTSANTSAETWMVLQAFTPLPVAQFPRLYGPNFDPDSNGVRAPVVRLFRSGYDLGAVPGFSQIGGAEGSGFQGPTEAELREMARISVRAGVSYIGWYGQSFLSPEDRRAWRPATRMGKSSLWQSVVRVSRETATGKLR